jgi:tol-pal system protein YbgF
VKRSNIVILVLAATLLGVVSGCQTTRSEAPAAPAATAPPPGAKPQPDFVRALVELEAMGVELARLRNELELQRNDMESMQRRQRELYDDLDYRLRARERGTSTVGQAGMPPVAGQTTYPPIVAPQGATGELPPMAGVTQGPMAGPDTGSAPPTAPSSADIAVQQPSTVTVEPWRTRYPTPGAPATAPPSIPAGPTAPVAARPSPAGPRLADADERLAYDEAFNKLKQSRYAEAIQAFQDLLNRFPNGALADDANYWIAEAQYVTRDFQSALNGFRNVVVRFPDSPRAPEALLKVGYIQFEVGAREQARITLNQVVTRYPGSRVAISAQTRLKRIERDGG